MPIPQPVAIVGATGNVGSRLVEKLTKKGIEVRPIARDVSKLEGKKHCQCQKADLTKPEEAKRAIQGAKAVYIAPPQEGADPLGAKEAVVKNVVEAAKAAGVQHIIIHTALHADKGNTGNKIIDNMSKVERIVTGSGIPYTILRPAQFMQNLQGVKKNMQRGEMPMPQSAERRVAFVSADDIAEAAVGFFEKGPQNRGFDMHVPRAETGPQLAEEMARALGKPVNFHETQPAEHMKGMTVESSVAPLFGDLFSYWKKADYTGKPDEITQALPGFHYTTPEEFARKELFQP